MMMSATFRATGSAVAVMTMMMCGTPTALAQLDAGDVVLGVEGGRIVTASADEATGQMTPGVRLFLAELGEFDSAAEPGFDAEEGQLPAGSVVGFDYVRALRVWNGSDFVQIAAPRIRMRLGPLQALTPPDDVLTPGLGLTVDDGGGYHHHFTITLLSQATPPAAPAEAGVYLLTLRMWCSDPLVRESEPFYIVVNQARPAAELDLAAAWVSANLLGSGPACRADFNGDGTLDPDDLSDYITCYFAIPACAAADFSGDGGVDPDDLSDVITAYFQGC